jgi:hypothetical protein
VTDESVGIGVGESDTDLEEHPAKIAVTPASQAMVDTTLIIKDEAEFRLE